VKISQTTELRARDAVASVLVDLLDLPTVYFDAPWLNSRSRVDCLPLIERVRATSMLSWIHERPGKSNCPETWYNLAMTLPSPVKRFSPSEYYELERKAGHKSDFYRGEIFSMAGGTARHSRICTNLIGILDQQLRGKPCVPYESNLRLMIRATGLRCYPDANVYCQDLEPDEEDQSGETFTNPAALFEVLSPSTEACDRGLKSANYRLIKSLKAYVLIAQDQPHVEVYQRQPNNAWLLNEVDGLDKSMRIEAIGIHLSLAEVYDRVEWPEH
jgi:Uma2 family endonuclease